MIKKLLPRGNYLERSDVYKRNAIAANVNQVLILAAIEPRASEEFIARVDFVRLGPDHRQSADDYDP